MTTTRPLLTAARGLGLAASTFAVVGCAGPFVPRGVSNAGYATVSSSDARSAGSAPAELPTVVVRDYRRSPTASVLGWSSDEAWQGLRATVRMDGSLVQDHQLYVSTYAFANAAAFVDADWHAFSQSLDSARVIRLAGVSRDVHSCEGRKGCSPYESFRVRIPDGFLRSSRDSIVVKVHGREGSESLITLRRDLIESYLAAVDSVAAARRKR